MSQNRISEVRTSRRESGQGQRLFSFRVTPLIWMGLVLFEALIALRIGLKLIGANPENPASHQYGSEPRQMLEAQPQHRSLRQEGKSE